MSTIELPSGMSFEAKRLNVKGMAKMGGSTKNLTAYNDLLADCSGAVVDPGPYDFKVGQPVDWKTALTGDRIAALLKLRSHTFGSTYEVGFQCPVMRCRHRWSQDLNLDELPYRHLTEEARAAFSAGNRYETTLPCDGRRVWFKLSNGAIEEQMNKRIGRGEDELHTLLLTRIIEIEGVEKLNKRHFIEGMDGQDCIELINLFDEQDCGVTTTLDVECPKCLYITEVELPLGEEFFRPKKKSLKDRPKMMVTSMREKDLDDDE
jgi:hypothetical protein